VIALPVGVPSVIVPIGPTVPLGVDLPVTAPIGRSGRVAVALHGAASIAPTVHQLRADPLGIVRIARTAQLGVGRLVTGQSGAASVLVAVDLLGTAPIVPTGLVAVALDGAASIVPTVHQLRVGPLGIVRIGRTARRVRVGPLVTAPIVPTGPPGVALHGTAPIAPTVHQLRVDPLGIDRTGAGRGARWVVGSRRVRVSGNGARRVCQGRRGWTRNSR
jgi:hypothetical protein